MSLIEQAARRLDELRRAGAELPEGMDAPAAPAAPSRAAPAGKVPGPRPGQSNVRDIDLAMLAAEGYVTPNDPQSRIADEFRIIKRPLIANVAGQSAAPISNANLVMVTSALPGEGKTFSSINLAMSIAMEVDRTVLLVDADVARPALPGRLGLPSAEAGLLDVLQDRSIDLGKVMCRTNVDRLSFLPCGRPHPRAAEMLASEAMTDLLQELATRYADRIVIFDSPPLLVTTEARVLATHMGQVVFVVHAESTSQDEVKRALATIESCPVKMAVLNRAKASAQGTYAYGYRYGH